MHRRSLLSAAVLTAFNTVRAEAQPSPPPAQFTLETSTGAGAGIGMQQTTEAYANWTSATFVEDRTSPGGVVMTLPRSIERGNWSLDYRGTRDTSDNQWKVEYFCEPDSVILVEDEAGAQGYYLGHLSVVDDLWVGEHAAQAAARYAPSMGNIAALLSNTQPIPTLPVDLTLGERVNEGQGKVWSAVTITNRAPAAKRITHIFQDAAFMWFPNGNQENVESIHLVATTTRGFIRAVNAESAWQTHAGEWQFAGTIDRTHGVIAGVLSFDPNDIAGISVGYVGVTALPYRRNLQFGRSAIPTTPQGASIAGRIAPPGRQVLNRFVASDYGVLAPGETATRSFVRIMAVIPSNPTDDQIQAWISSKVVAHYNGN